MAALRAKVPVGLYDRSPEQISKGLNLMDRLLAKDVSKGKIQEADARHARERVYVVDQAVGLRALRDVDMVIEVRRQTDFLLQVHRMRTQGCLGKPRSQAAHIWGTCSGDEA